MRRQNFENGLEKSFTYNTLTHRRLNFDHFSDPFLVFGLALLQQQFFQRHMGLVSGNGSPSSADGSGDGKEHVSLAPAPLSVPFQTS